MRLGLDIDGVICDFTGGVFRAAGVPLTRYADIQGYDYTPVLNFREIWERIKGDELFWLGLAPVETHIPHCCGVYLTSRDCSDAVTRQWLHVHGFPKLPIINTRDKARAIEVQELDGLVDDCAAHFLAAEKVASCNFLVSRPWNREVVTPRRIYRLEELEWRA